MEDGRFEAAWQGSGKKFCQDVKKRKKGGGVKIVKKNLKILKDNFASYPQIQSNYLFFANFGAKSDVAISIKIQENELTYPKLT